MQIIARSLPGRRICAQNIITKSCCLAPSESLRLVPPPHPVSKWPGTETDNRSLDSRFFLMVDISFVQKWPLLTAICYFAVALKPRWLLLFLSFEDLEEVKNFCRSHSGLRQLAMVHFSGRRSRQIACIMTRFSEKPVLRMAIADISEE